MAAKLKVFTWSDGFHAYTVATTSRAKALAEWGVTRDLFKDGDAVEIASGADHDAALAKPGETIRRGLSVDVGKVALVTKAKPPSKGEVERVAKLERDLAALADAHEAAVAKLDDRRARLEDEAAAVEADYRARSEATAKDLETARRKLRD
jgi:hypothetical protein